MRSGVLKILNDTYNANPDAVKAALDVLASTYGRRRIAVLADMLELGEFTEDLHRKTGEYVVGKGIDVLVTVGSAASFIADGAENTGKEIQIYRFPDHEALLQQASDIFEAEDVVLVKGSHSMHMDVVTDSLKQLGAELDGEEKGHE